jgi:chromate transporter
MIYLELIWAFFKIGAFTFGGGFSMITLIQSEVVAHGWMSNADLINFIAVSESTPGPLAVNMATYIGSEVAGFPGALCATFAVVLPSFIIVLIVAKIYSSFAKNKYIASCMSGLKPAVIWLIAAALFSFLHEVFFPETVALSVLTGSAFWISAGILAVDLLLSFKKVHPILIIVISACLGIAVGYTQKLIF